MKRRGLGGTLTGTLTGAMLAVFWALVLMAAPACAAPRNTTTKPTLDLRQHPTGGKTPVDVAVGLYVTNFVGIDETRESFEVGGYLTAKWLDPRLALPPDAASDAPATRTYRLDQLWTPSIESANSISHKTSQSLLTADRNGLVTYVERFDANLSSDFDLRKFPFDTQDLRFQFHPFISAASEIRFTPRPLPSTGISPEQHTELAAWHIQDIRYRTEKVIEDREIPPTSGAEFQIAVKRRSGFYIWKIFVPLLMLTMIPMVAFWIDVSQFDWVLKIPMTMLLSMVAFEFTIARDLPRVGYLTFLDAVFLASFAFCFFCIFEIAAVFLLQQHGKRPLAVKLHTKGKWAYPLAYFGLISILAIGFLA
jgi:Neurotransmitter-gated ion-channel ligand binding domain